MKKIWIFDFLKGTFSNITGNNSLSNATFSYWLFAGFEWITQPISLLWLAKIMGTWEMRIETKHSKRNKTKSTETKQNWPKRNETNRNETKLNKNKSKRNKTETKSNRNRPKRNESPKIYIFQIKLFITYICNITMINCILTIYNIFTSYQFL